jgi:hypothetical protein
MIKTKLGYVWRRFRHIMANILRSLWAQATAPPDSSGRFGSVGPRWSGADYDAAKVEQEEGYPVAEAPQPRPEGPIYPPMR